MNAQPVKERPILFSGEMVKAILEGKKTQTRRVVKHQGEDTVRAEVVPPWVHLYDESEPVPGTTNRLGKMWTTKCPYGAPGDRLYVKETWQARFVQPDESVGWAHETVTNRRVGSCCDELYYRATNDAFYFYEEDYERGGSGEPGHPALRCEIYEPPPRWMSPLFMPRWASRLTLEVTDVRVERLHRISEADAEAEGVGDEFGDHYLTFMGLWNQINGPRGYGWEANPWVWVVTFRRVEA